MTATSYAGDGSALTGVGKVLQVVSPTHYTTTGSTTSSTLTNSGVSATITPSSTSSKILVLGSFALGISAQANRTGVGLRRDSTDIGLGVASGSRPAVFNGSGLADQYTVTGIPIAFLDSPSTTSATTYHLTYRARSGYTSYINRSGDDADAVYNVRAASHITLIEIGA
jgi:hypothetical protein